MVNLKIGVIVTQEDRKRLEKVCEARGELMSNFIRRSIRKELASLSYYPDDVKKALGIINSPRILNNEKICHS